MENNGYQQNMGMLGMGMNQQNMGMPNMNQMPGMGMGQNPGMGQMPGMGMGQQMNYQNPGMGMPQQNMGMQQNQQYEQKPPSTVVEVARSNYTTISLLEVSGGYDPALKFPKSLCFVMGVPGLKDASKQSGRTYNQDAKITMKFSTQEIRSLGHSLINIAIFKQVAAPFEKHSDPSKNTYTQNNGQQQNTKKFKAAFDPSRGNIVITMNYGTKNVMVPVPLQDALGLGEDLINIGNYTDAKLFDYKMAHKIGREEVTGIDYDPAGVEDHNATMPQQNFGIQQQPQAQAQQVYNPAQYQQQAQQAQQAQPMSGMPGTGYPGYPAGIPGAQ